MTVEQLIERLQEEPPDAEVFINKDGSYAPAEGIDAYNAIPELKIPAQVFIRDTEVACRDTVKQFAPFGKNFDMMFTHLV